VGSSILPAFSSRSASVLNREPSALGCLPRVDEDQRRLVVGDDLADRPDVTRGCLVDRQLPGEGRVAVRNRRVEHAHVGPGPGRDLDYLELPVAGMVGVALAAPDEELPDLLGVPTVAESPIRWNGPATRRRRSSPTVSWAPRFAEASS